MDGAELEARLVSLNEACLQAYFSYPLQTAARELGLSATALKWLDISIFLQQFDAADLLLHFLSVHAERLELRRGLIVRYLIDAVLSSSGELILALYPPRS